MPIAAVDLQGPMSSAKVKSLNGRSSSVNWKKSVEKHRICFPGQGAPKHVQVIKCSENCLGVQARSRDLGSVRACTNKNTRKTVQKGL